MINILSAIYRNLLTFDIKLESGSRSSGAPEAQSTEEASPDELDNLESILGEYFTVGSNAKKSAIFNELAVKIARDQGGEKKKVLEEALQYIFKRREFEEGKNLRYRTEIIGSIKLYC